MKKTTCKDPNADATSKQTFAIFCITKTDVRKHELTRQQASDIITSLNENGVATLPDDSQLYHKDNKGEVKWDKVRKPYSIKKGNGSSWAIDLFKKAEAAGREAIEELVASNTVTPMVVAQHENPMDDNSPVEQQWVVAGGPCGFAWITVKCKNGPSRKFINQLKKAGEAGGENDHSCRWRKSSYYGGFMYWVHDGGQSMAYKEAYARAFTDVLVKEEIHAYSGSRMD